jgi:CBS domain-containing protein
MADGNSPGGENGLGFTCPQCERTVPSPADACSDCVVDLCSVTWPVVRKDAFDISLLATTLESLRPAPPIILPPDATVADAIEKLCQRKVGCVLIGREDDIRGIFSERDALLRVADRYDQAATARVTHYMTPAPTMLEIDTPVAFALRLMGDGKFRHLPVTRDGIVVGVVSGRDLIAFLDQRFPGLLSA